MSIPPGQLRKRGESEENRPLSPPYRVLVRISDNPRRKKHVVKIPVSTSLLLLTTLTLRTNRTLFSTILPNNNYKMFRNDAAPSPPQSAHAPLREFAFNVEPQKFGNNLVEESCASEMQQGPPSLLPRSSTSDTDTTALIRTIMAPVMVRSATQESRHPNWLPLRERNHRRRLTPPDLETIIESFEEHDQATIVLEGEERIGVPPESGVEMAGSSKKKRGHRRNNCLLMGDFFDLI